jgi:hypothetical protein
MTTTRKVTLAGFFAFVLLCGVGLAYEIKTLVDTIPNNTISHIVALLTAQYPTLPYWIVGSFGFFVLFWTTVFLHWWKPGFWWKAAVFVAQKTNKKEDTKS